MRTKAMGKGRLKDKTPPQRHQVAALPLRWRGGRIEVCLITTRETRRWSIPKGWPMKGRKDHTAAALEAEQEAGLYGQIGRRPIGTYDYWKRYTEHFEMLPVHVYRLDVEGQHHSWQEQGQRNVQWAQL